MTASRQIRSVASWKNLERAWLWTTTNSDRTYKRYFRDLYRAYALIEEEGLARLRDQLLTSSLQPRHPTKLFFPKESGVQRPITLLTVEDQVTYQALVNPIAERLFRRVGHRYNHITFGHLYAGPNGLFFYRDWRRSYRAFTGAMRRAFKDGYRFTASFDLTAFYDSIDHAVLRHFLKQMHFDVEYCELLCALLSHWTETSGSRRPVYHGHGLPQGPQPSGLLAEVVLKYFDDADRPRDVRYFRYVDDIRLFARSEEALRYELVKLDVRSKEIGLFPQSSKIHIHRVRRIEDEFKTISRPTEPSGLDPSIPASVVRRRLIELTPRFRVPDPTRFKYVLGGAQPSVTIVRRLLKVLRLEPHLYDAVFRYVERCPRLSRQVSDEFLALLRAYELYPAFTAGLIRALQFNIHPSQRVVLQRYCRRRLSGAYATNDPELRAVAAGVLLRDGAATWAQTKYNVTWRRSWWVRCYLLPLVNEGIVGPSSLGAIVNVALRDDVADVSLVAAELAIIRKLPIEKPIATIHDRAQLALRRAGRIGRLATRTCPISLAAAAVLGPQIKQIGWRRMFQGPRYRALLSRMVVWRAYAATDATAWSSLTDTINDILLSALFAHDGTIGTYVLGNIGTYLNPTSRFALRYPRMFRAADEMHKLRLKADLVHPITRSSQLPTRRIRHAELRRPKRWLADGWLELWNQW